MGMNKSGVVNGILRRESRGGIRVGRIFAWAAALAWVLTLAACSRFQTPETEPLFATGYGSFAGAKSLTAPETGEGKVPGGLPNWARETLEESGEARLPQGAQTPVEAMLAARRQASDAALRRLAARVIQLPATAEQPLALQMQTRPELQLKVEEIIRTRTRFKDISTSENADTYRLQAELDLAPVAELVAGEGAAKTQPKPAQPRKEARIQKAQTAEDREAYRVAQKDARATLLQQVGQEMLTPNYTVRMRMATDPAARSTVEKAVREAKIVSVTFPQPGQCEMVLSLELEDLLSRLRSQN
jgi:hypothetical protein